MRNALANNIQKLGELGQAVWCDNISRAMIDSGQLKGMIDDGIVGVTSNPTIFKNAVTGSSDYDALFNSLVQDGGSDMDVYEGLVLPDIRDGAEVLREVFERTGGVDGLISLEVNPKLAYQTRETIEEARRLSQAVGRPNLLIKVPATEQGLPAVETLIGEGISVNVTLIFSIAMYEKVMQAYLAGLEKFDAARGDISKVGSVASFFVSRVDTLVDKKLEDRRVGNAHHSQPVGNAHPTAAGEDPRDLFGRAAIANAKLAYAAFKRVFHQEERFTALARRGARVQRPLWASTSTKNPAYPDTMYVDGLIGAETVNTIPVATLEAFLDHGEPRPTLEQGLNEAQATMDHLAGLGIDMKDVTDQLLRDGVDLFAASFDALLDNIAGKRASRRH